MWGSGHENFDPTRWSQRRACTPVLAQATVGVAMGSGTDVARESSHIVLIGSDLTKFAKTVQLARRCGAPSCRTRRHHCRGQYWRWTGGVWFPQSAAGRLHRRVVVDDLHSEFRQAASAHILCQQICSWATAPVDFGHELGAAFVPFSIDPGVSRHRFRR